MFFIFGLAFVSQFAGTVFLGTKVAKSTFYGLFNVPIIQNEPNQISIMICAGVLGAIIWNLITWVRKIPSSSSHAIICGLMGPFIMNYGFYIINLKGLILSVLIPLFTSPIIGYIIGYYIYKLNEKIFIGRSCRIKKFLQGIQISTCVLINAFQGSNDAQKGIGILALLLIITAGAHNFYVPEYIIILAALTIVLGLILGGMKMIRSVGKKIYSVRTLHSMSAQVASTLVIGAASLLGFPVSGTQIVNSSIFGVGAADRPAGVGWLYAKEMLIAWLITIPASFFISSLFYFLFRWIGG